jgi:hypothetical protein
MWEGNHPMDNSIDQQRAEAQSKTIFSVNLPKIIDNLLNRILSPFLLTEEEKQEAGIYIGRLGKDE